ncbi:MAG: YjbQ family protein, partial [Candidatus Lokiarchaeota archaeon]|nr:YjbQ family protein [Candidatus Lokiarchaeota archaeon]
MSVVLKTFTIRTKPKSDVINITENVKQALDATDLKDGIVCIHVAGSTGALSTLEYEPGLVRTDVPKFLEKIIPYNRDYEHHKTWGDANGAGHLRSFLLSNSVCVPFSNGDLLLGTWQKLIFVECDE